MTFAESLTMLDVSSMKSSALTAGRQMNAGSARKPHPVEKSYGNQVRILKHLDFSSEAIDIKHFAQLTLPYTCIYINIRTHIND